MVIVQVASLAVAGVRGGRSGWRDSAEHGAAPGPALALAGDREMWGEESRRVEVRNTTEILERF